MDARIIESLRRQFPDAEIVGDESAVQPVDGGWVALVCRIEGSMHNGESVQIYSEHVVSRNAPRVWPTRPEAVEALQR